MAQQAKVFKNLDFMEAQTGTRKVRFDTETTANILYILPYAANTDIVYFGNGTLQMDLRLVGASSAKYLTWDASADKLVATGAVGIELSTTSWFLLPVKATDTGQVNGRMWYDTSDNYIHYYANGAEMKLTHNAA